MLGDDDDGGGHSDDADSEAEQSYRLTESGGASRFSQRATAPPRRLSASVIPRAVLDDRAGADDSAPDDHDQSSKESARGVLAGRSSLPPAPAPWTKLQLSALLASLHIFGYGRPSAARHAHPCLMTRSAAEVNGAADVMVMIALACMREQVRPPA